eukprot:6767014-Alexandrium_andersonii.AAC.1
MLPGLAGSPGRGGPGPPSASVELGSSPSRASARPNALMARSPAVAWRLWAFSGATGSRSGRA